MADIALNIASNIAPNIDPRLKRSLWLPGRPAPELFSGDSEAGPSTALVALAPTSRFASNQVWYMEKTNIRVRSSTATTERCPYFTSDLQSHERI